MTYRTNFADFYSQYGRETDVYKHELYLYGRRPGAIYALDELQREDERSATMIADLESMVDCLKQHRQAIAARYQELATAPTVPVITLKRTNTSYKGIQYTLTEYRQYLDGTRTEIRHTTYSGKERHKAIASFNAAVKAHPGITAEMDIAKGRWER